MRLGDHNRVFGKLVGNVTGGRIRLHFRKNVPDSGQEHPANGDDSLFVSATSLQSAVALLAFRKLVGLDNSVCDLDKNGLEVSASPRDAGRFHFTVALVIAGGSSLPRKPDALR